MSTRKVVTRVQTSVKEQRTQEQGPPSENPVPASDVSAATLPGGTGRNQDWSVTDVPGALVVLDGATSWLPQDPEKDGGWFARTLGTTLSDLLRTGSGDLSNILFQALVTMQKRYDLDPIHSPTSTVAILRWDTGIVEGLVLADSPIVVRTQDDTDVLEDGRLAAVAAEQRSACTEHLRAGLGFGGTFRDLLQRLQLEERRWRNRPGGFWVAGGVPEAAEHAITTSWPREQVTLAAALTDGAAAGVLDYGLDDWTTLCAKLLKGTPADVIHDVESAELNDPEGLRWPRTKRHDDKTIGLVRFGTGTVGPDC